MSRWMNCVELYLCDHSMDEVCSVCSVVEVYFLQIFQQQMMETLYHLQDSLTKKSEQYMLFPNLSICVNGEHYVGLAIKLQHEMCISWNGLKCRHCTTEAASGVTDTFALFFGVPDYDMKPSMIRNITDGDAG